MVSRASTGRRDERNSIAATLTGAPLQSSLWCRISSSILLPVMSATFTPSSVIDMEKERDWAANLGMLDWDNTQIVFSKRSLLEFLKYAGVTVDPNFTNIQKLPRYARFGTQSGGGDVEPEATIQQESATTAAQQADNAYRPSRRVRTAPGGGHTNIFGTDTDDALAAAPPRAVQAPSAVASPETTADAVPKATPEDTAPESRPKLYASSDNFNWPLMATCRSKRNTSSGVGSLWDEPAPKEFKPTRRVREMPGGKDSISSLF
ncbi:hypothetical protein EVJ58_g7221 [Rhodofomes roseus]|uniref:Uncharacterized protein n=1 Tax=Rhodofomes roseus TaxID=34475 RepID=A0A4Y9Y691_9APHY|nr:hypothetical protein EVJ58_g7221 [Rhodofomes roseus]